MGKAEEMEAHSSQTSQKSLAPELYLAIWLPFSFPPPTTFFWISPPTPIPTLPTFFFEACHLFPYTTLLREWKARINIPFTFAPFVLAQARKKKKKRKKKKSLATSVNRLGRDMWKNRIRVHVCNMFLGNMLMCCSSENNLLIRRVLFVGAYMLTSAKCMVSWFETTVFRSAERERGDELVRIWFFNWK